MQYIAVHFNVILLYAHIVNTYYIVVQIPKLRELLFHNIYYSLFQLSWPHYSR